MHPVLRRILLHGGLTAALLAGLGALFAELASVWLIGNGPRGTAGATDPTDPVGAALRTRVPLTLALWGFLFVLVGELVIWGVRGHRPAVKPTEAPQDEAEKLLNELLAQAKAKMAAEAKEPGDPNPPAGADGPSADAPAAPRS